MTEKNSELPLTGEAIAELSKALAQLNEIIGQKKNELTRQEKKQLAEAKESKAKIDLLKSTSLKILENINNVQKRLDKVLENNGASNNNN